MPRKKVRELSVKKANLTRVKVQIPQHIMEQMSLRKNQSTMWLCGFYMGSFMLSPQSPDDKGKRQMYPLPKSVTVSDIADWEIVRILK